MESNFINETALFSQTFHSYWHDSCNVALRISALLGKEWIEPVLHSVPIKWHDMLWSKTGDIFPDLKPHSHVKSFSCCVPHHSFLVFSRQAIGEVDIFDSCILFSN